MRSRHLVIGVGLIGALAAVAPHALAQTASAAPAPYPAACTGGSVPAAETERAHTLYGAGKIQYDDRNYDSAIAQFREAYKRDCSKHELLVIISRAYELKGDKAEALHALELYVERVPGSPDASSHRAGIEYLKKQIAAQKAAPQAPPGASGASGAPDASGAPGASDGASKPPSSGETREHTVPPWIVVGVGGAVALAGLILILETPNTNCDLAAHSCTRGDETDGEFVARQQDAGRERYWSFWGPFALVTGGVIAAGGLAWHFLEPTGPAHTGAQRTRTPTVSPEAGSGYAGFSLRGTF